MDFKDFKYIANCRNLFTRLFGQKRVKSPNMSTFYQQINLSIMPDSIICRVRHNNTSVNQLTLQIYSQPELLQYLVTNVRCSWGLHEVCIIPAALPVGIYPTTPEDQWTDKHLLSEMIPFTCFKLVYLIIWGFCMSPCSRTLPGAYPYTRPLVNL